MRRFNRLVLLILILGRQSQCTTIIHAITRDGIVIGTDSKLLESKFNPKTKRYDQISFPGVKAVILKNNTVLASDGKIRFSDFRFSNLARDIDAKIRPTTSIDDVVELLKIAVPAAFLPYRGRHLADFQSTNYFVEYILAGYKSGQPLVYCLTFRANPTTDILLVDPVGPANQAWGQYGLSVAWDALTDANSTFSRMLDKDFPRKRDQLLQSLHLRTQFLPFSLDEAVTQVRVALEFESHASSDSVGFPLRLILIPRCGKARLRIFTRDRTAVH